MKKILYILLINLTILLSGCIKDRGGETERPVAEYTIVNSLSETIYYETVFTLIEISDNDNSEDKYNYDLKKQGEIGAGNYQDLGKTGQFVYETDDLYTFHTIDLINIYSDAEHTNLLYSYKVGDTEEAKKIFIYGAGEEFNFLELENRVIFNMTEDKIIK